MGKIHKTERFVLFDLDGTLIPLSRDQFEPALFQDLGGFFHRNFPELGEQFMQKVGQMAFADGDRTATNEERFIWAVVREAGALADAVLAGLDRHYATDYNDLCRLLQNPSPAEDLLSAVEAAKAVPVLATNPITPAGCIKARLGWIGMKPERFRLVTSYEAFHFTKPDPRYYQEIMEMLGAQPGQCLMVGNDTLEDMDGASRAGLVVFLLTDYLRDPGHTAHRYRRGSKMELLRFLDEYLNEVNG